MKNIPSTSRRRFLQTSVAVPAAVAGLSGSRATAAEQSGSSGGEPLPKRKLGRNGPEVTILNLGGMMSAHKPQYLDVAWEAGIRYFDTADCYLSGRSEENISQWLKRYPERRKELFLVDKDHPRQGPKQLLKQIDERLDACGTDYFDLFFIHAIGPNQYGDDSLEWPKSNELGDVFQELKESGKARMCGFSCHDMRLNDYLFAAAEGGIVDAIMMRYSALHDKGREFDQALDECHKAGIGLISMKEMRPFRNVPKKNPDLQPLGLTTHQAVLHQVWTDERIASVCSNMDNVDMIEENAMAARMFKGPLPDKGRRTLEQLALMEKSPMCPGCPSCDEWGRKTQYAFQDISRYVTYYEEDAPENTKGLYNALSARERDASGVDLDAIRKGCRYEVDYPEISKRAAYYFA